jgi:hypothetical protein
MSKRRRVRSLVLILTLSASCPSIAWAQVFGTFPWQMQPYCNVVTLTLTHTPAGFTLDGADNQCGATTKASVVGIASFDPDSSVGLNFTIVTTPGAKGVHVAARVNPANGQGIWTDSVGNSGTFAFFGNTPGLPPRPLPASGVSPGVITTVELAPGAVGAADVNATEVQVRVNGTCPVGHYLRGIMVDGSVLCHPLSAGADHGGAVKTGSLSAHIPATGSPPEELRTLSFTAPISGVAVLQSRGTCTITGAAAGVGINIAVGPDATSAFDTQLNPASRWGIMRVAPGAGVLHQLGWTTRNELPVVAGTSYSQGLFGRGAGGAQAPTDTCFGTFSISFHSAVLP